MGVPSNKPTICGHCGEADLKKLVPKHGKPQRICRKCKYAQKLRNIEIQNDGAFELEETRVSCMNGHNWSEVFKHEKGTRAPRKMCPFCHKKNDGVIDNCGVGNHWSFDR